MSCAPAAAAPRPEYAASLRTAERRALRLLESGDLERARAAFDQLRSRDRSRALLGLLRQAELSGDRAALEALLDEIDRCAAVSPKVLVFAAGLALAQARDSALTQRLLHRTLELDRGRGLLRELRAMRARSRLGTRSAPPPPTRSCTLPLTFRHGLPVVAAALGEGPPAHFILDTGASVCALSRSFGERSGIAAVGGTAHEVSSFAGPLSTRFAWMDLRLAGLRPRMLPAVLVDLPIPDIAGVLSPQRAFPGCVLELDFARSFLRVRTRGVSPTSVRATEPLFMAGGCPHVRVRVAGYAERLFLLDTGANRTHLIVPRARVPASGRGAGAASAGGRKAAAWVRDRPSVVTIAGLPWRWDRPRCMAAEPSGFIGEFAAGGMVGMDFLAGRSLMLDLTCAKLSISGTQIS